MNKCRAALLGGALTAGIANLLGAVAVGASLVGELSHSKIVMQCAFWLAVVAISFLSALGGALGGAAATGCFEPPPGGGGGGGPGGGGPGEGGPPHGRPAGGPSTRIIILLTFVPALGGAAIAIVELLATRNSSGVLGGFVIDEAGTIMQLAIVLPLAYRSWSRLMIINMPYVIGSS
jgi:hypothetical protein